MLKFEELGVDLGSDSIKIVSLRKMSVQSKLTKVDHKETYEVECEQFSEEYFEVLKNAIKSFSKKHKIKRMSLNLSLALDNKNTFIEFITMPELPKKVLDSGVNLENEQKLASKGITNVYSSWKKLSENKEKEEITILTANIKKRVLDSLAQFKTINCKINKVILQPIASEAVVIENSAIINFGVNSTRVSLYKNKRLTHVEIIQTGAKDLLKSIEDFSALSGITETPEELLSSLEVYNDKVQSATTVSSEEEDWYGDSFVDDKKEEEVEENQETNLLSLHINSLISELAEEIKKSVRMFELRNSVSLEKAFISGKLSSVKYFKEKIESELDIEVDFLDLAGLDNDLDNATYSNAILIAKDPRDKEETNFVKHIKANVDYTALVVLALTLSLSIGGALKLSGDNYMEELEKVQAKETEQLSTLSAINTEISLIESEIDDYEKYITKINSLKAEKKWLSDILYVIPEKTPLESAISFISVGEEHIDLYGYTSNYSTIGFFAKSLEEIAETEVESITPFKGIEGLNTKEIYSVTMDKPELISDKYLMNQAFHITLKYKSNLLDHE